MATRPYRPDRRTVLWLGGGAIALAVGIGAEVLDRRSSPATGAGGATEPAPTGPPTTAAPATTATTTTVAPSPEPEPVAQATAPVVTGEVTAGVIAVGRAYLRAEPDEADLAALLTALPAPDGDVVAAARQYVAADFEARDTVVIDGWILARSEARAAAVLALACPDGC